MLLTDPSRRTTPGATGRTHLLSGIARCGACGGPMRAAKGKAYKGVSVSIYRCQAKVCVTRAQEPVDDLVRDVVCERLARPDAVDLLLPVEEPAAAVAARAQVEALRSRLDVAAADYADENITAEQLRTITARLRPRLEAAERSVPAPPVRTAVLEALAGRPDARRRWDALDVSVRRQVVDALVSVTVLKTRRGPGFDPESVEITWKGTTSEGHQP